MHVRVQEALAARLAGLVLGRGVRLSTGFLGTRDLLGVLCDAGSED